MKQGLMLGLFSAVFMLAWPVWAEMDGTTWLKQSDEFKRGYAAGHLEVETLWGMSLIPGGVLSEERARTLEVLSSLTRYIARCVHKNTISFDQLKALTHEYLHQYPMKAKEPISLTMPSALGPVCERSIVP
jgi:hypothetical protein